MASSSFKKSSIATPVTPANGGTGIANSKTLTVPDTASVSGTNTGDQTLSSLGAEAVANKENTTLDTSTTKYPTINLLKTKLDLKANLDSPVFTTKIDLTSGNISAIDGNFIVGSAGHGIDFSADSSAGGMTSELLDDYEEGTWTPVATSQNGTITTYTSSGVYTKIGRLVTVNATITITNKGSGTGNLYLAGLPFTSLSGSIDFCGIATTGGLTAIVYLYNNSSIITLRLYNNGVTVTPVDNTTWIIVMQYIT